MTVGIGIGVGVVIFFTLLIYNSLIGKKNEVENSFGGVDVQLKKRYDLIPNLVSSVKQYMQHEKQLFEKITELRTQALKGHLSSDQKVALDNQISKALHGILISVENYPDLKASENFVMLQQSLNEVEAQISAARRAYNAAVTDYNNAIEMFPSNVVAKMLSYRRKQVFEATSVERQNVNVGSMFN